MLNKEFYDVISLVFILFMVVGIFAGSIYIGFVSDGEMSFDEKSYAVMKATVISNFILMTVFGVYGLFVIMLSIQMFRKKLVSGGWLAGVILLFPFAIFFYSFILRGRFK